MTLLQYLQKRRLSVREFAKIADISPATVSRVANGNPPTLANALKIERACKGDVLVDEMVRA